MYKKSTYRLIIEWLRNRLSFWNLIKKIQERKTKQVTKTCQLHFGQTINGKIEKNKSRQKNKNTKQNVKKEKEKKNQGRKRENERKSIYLFIMCVKCNFI